MSKYSINLFQAELLPEQPALTLNKVVSFWALALVVMVFLSFLSSYQSQQNAAALKVLRASEAQNKQRLTELEQQITATRTDSVLVERLALMKSMIINKQALHGQLTDNSRTYVQGFSGAMTELSSLHNDNVSLQAITISNDDLTFAGIARKPEAVPAWLDAFEQSTLLSGKAFVNFKLQENENNLTEFVVSSIAQTKAQ